MEFQVLSWHGLDTDDEGYYVYLFGRTSEGKSVAVRCPFSPYFFVAVPDFFTDTHVRMMMRNLPGCVSAKLVKRKVFWGFSNETEFPFARLLFRSQRDMSRTVSRLRFGRVNLGTGPMQWKLYETQIDPLLRFMHVTNVQASGWATLTKSIPVLDKSTNCEEEYEITSWTHIKPVNREDVSPCVFLSYDIETFSADGSFPNPENSKCPIIQIALTLWRYGETDPYAKHLLTLKECDPIEGVHVESFESERDLLDRWAHWFGVHDPDFTITYNGWGFDDHYIYTRMRCVGSTAGLFFGRFRSDPITMVDKKLSSAAYGDNAYKMFKMPGRTQIDLLQVLKRDQKLTSYSLNNVSKTFLNDKKVDMPYQHMFDLFEKGIASDIALIGEYCVYDTVLPIRLIQKLSIIPNLVEMSKACWVPIDYLLTRGQQIKVFSQLTYFTRLENMVVPTLERNPGDGASSDGEKGYVGATVLAARSGAYMNDIITCLDFASLYPSIMRAHNLCHSTMVMDKKYENIPGIEYASFDVQGTRYTFVQNVPGILPRLLEQLAKRRKEAKREMAKAADAGDSFAESVYNGKQLAFKVSMNSIYGFCGAVNGFLPCMAVASTVTSIGRHMIEQSKAYAEEHFDGAQVVYGDSVSETTPVYIRFGQTFHFVTVSDLCQRYGTGPWRNMHGKHRDKMTREMVPGVYAWTEHGWTPVQRVIRHRLVGKRMFRVTTAHGSVDVTEDHSLLDERKRPIAPKQCFVDETKLLHAKCPLPYSYDTQQEGNTDTDLNQVFEWGLKADYAKLEEGGIWTGSALRKMTFLDGLRFAPGNDASNFHVYDAMHAAKLFAMLRGMGVRTALKDLGDDGWKIVFGRLAKDIEGMDPDTVRSIRPIEYEGEVYDLTTDTHHFHAGIGELIVHNTDSIFVKFRSDESLSKEEQMKKAFELGETSAQAITKIFKAPIELEFEKTYSPLLLFTKKRYCGLMYAAETGWEKPKKIDVKGMSVVRRDSTPFVNGVLKGMIEKIMYEKAVEEAIALVERETRRLLDQKVSADELVMSKTLRSQYKNENLAHLGVVEKIKKRNPGSEPKSGSRVPYVFVDHEKPDALQFDRAEDPEYAKEKQLPIDAAYYLEHCLINPVSQLLTLFVENPSQEIFGPFLKELREQRQRKLADWKRTSEKIRDIRTFFGPSS